MPNGLWRFIFGVYKEEDKNQFNIPDGEPPIEMLVYGSIKMRCFRKTCREWNTLHFFPSSDVFNLVGEEKGSSIRDEVLAK